MRAYYINLTRREDRRANMEAQFERLGIAAERVEAFPTDQLTPAQLATYCSLDLFEPLLPSELCCTLSHRSALRKFLDSGDAFAAVFEDDAVISPQLLGLLASIDRDGLPCDILRLETFLERTQVSAHRLGQIGSLALHSMQGWTWGSAAYVISRRAAQLYLNCHRLDRIVIDRALWRCFPDVAPVSALQLNPALAVQEDRLDAHGEQVSDIARERSEAASRHQRVRLPLPYLLRRFWRFEIGVALPALLHRLAGRSMRGIVPFAEDDVCVAPDKVLQPRPANQRPAKAC